MKRIVTTLLFAASLLAVVTVSHTPASPLQNNTADQCCDDPFPQCPPICGGGGQAK